MTDLYADSTVAMTAYNLLALTGGSTLDDLLDSVRTMAHPELDLEQLRRAVAELVMRKLAVKAPANSANGARMLYSIVDAKRRLVVGRNRADMVEEDDGSISGGWGFWVVRSVNGLLASIKEVAQ